MSGRFVLFTEKNKKYYFGLYEFIFLEYEYINTIYRSSFILYLLSVCF